MSSPFSIFRGESARVAGDLVHRRRIGAAMGKYEAARGPRQQAFRSWERARQAAAETKWSAVNRLADHLEQFEAAALARGTKVHWCRDADEARAVMVGIIRGHGARRIVKSKVMTSEEIHLNPLLESLGFSVVESDLGSTFSS